MIKKLISRFNNKNFTVGIIGLGYVGLPICERFSKAGIKVICVDSDLNKIKSQQKELSNINNNKIKN